MQPVSKKPAAVVTVLERKSQRAVYPAKAERIGCKMLGDGHLVHVQFQAQLLPQKIPHQGNHFPEPGFTSGHHGGYFQLGHTAEKNAVGLSNALANRTGTAQMLFFL